MQRKDVAEMAKGKHRQFSIYTESRDSNEQFDEIRLFCLIVGQFGTDLIAFGAKRTWINLCVCVCNVCDVCV